MRNATILGFFNPQKEGDTFHGLNSSIDGRVAPSVIRGLPEFLKAAGRDYSILKVPARYTDPFGGLDAEGQPVAMDRDVEGQFHLMRSSDGKVVSPHTVTGQYGQVSLSDLAEDVNPWVSEGWATPDGVYEGRDGSLEILSLRLDAGSDDATASEFRHYAILCNPHGTAKVSGKIISWRIVCANTFAAAYAAASDFVITHRVANGSAEMQSAIMASRRKLAVETWTNLRNHVRTLAERTEALRSFPLPLTEATVLTDKLLDIEGKAEEDISGQASKRKDGILQAFNMPRFGTNGQTAYDWLNAVTFELSSPNSPRVRASKVSGVDRMIRNVDTNGVGRAMEAKASKLLQEIMA